MTPLHHDALTDECDTLFAPSSALEERPLGLLAEAVLGENAELMKEAAGLQWLCRALIQGSLPGGFELEKRLEEFEERLLLHFAAEEAEEFFGTLMTDQPSFLQRAAEAEAEHAELLLELDELLDTGQAEAPSRELAVRLLRFLERLDAHEHAEKELLQDLVLLEEGGEG
jgi:hypothetical protein